jgi:hypothetical protein
MVNQAVKRDMKFSELVLYNVTTEYTDRLDSLMKGARSVRLCKSTFRQIFPKEMTNEAENEIELLQMEEVDFRVKNTIFRGDRLKALSLN